MSRKNHRHPPPTPPRSGPTSAAVGQPPGHTGNEPTAFAGRDPAEAIRTRAYYKWVEAGCPPGDGIRFWLEAESERDRTGGRS